MTDQRFQVMEENPLTVWDSMEEHTIHLGSQVDARDLAELLNSMDRRLKNSIEEIGHQARTIARLAERLKEYEAKEEVELNYLEGKEEHF